MLKPQVLAALNKQIQHELTASYTYLGLSVFFEQEVLKGFAAYFRKQAEEERGHAMKILGYVEDSNAKAELAAIPAAKASFKSPLDALKAARDFEKDTTASIIAVYAVAVKENDLATQNMLQWFIKEQVEEEKWTEEFVATGEKLGTHTGAWYMFDHHVSKLVEK